MTGDTGFDPTATRVLCDAMLGRLTTYLRMCGYDTVFGPDRGLATDAAVLRVLDTENRLLLTADTELADRAPATILVPRTDIETKLTTIADAGFTLALTTPTRCSTCNGELDRLDPTESTGETVPDPGSEPVWACIDCGNHYWRGSHWDDVADRLTAVTG